MASNPQTHRGNISPLQNNQLNQYAQSAIFVQTQFSNAGTQATFSTQNPMMSASAMYQNVPQLPPMHTYPNITSVLQMVRHQDTSIQIIQPKHRITS